jgi:hypothetical protein
MIMQSTAKKLIFTLVAAIISRLILPLLRFTGRPLAKSSVFLNY